MLGNIIITEVLAGKDFESGCALDVGLMGIVVVIGLEGGCVHSVLCNNVTDVNNICNDPYHFLIDIFRLSRSIFCCALLLSTMYPFYLPTR